MLDLNSINGWTKGRFAMRSGYYAGRGPNRGDLDSRILEMLYQGVKHEAGGETAANFVRFVNKLEDLSASSFIVAFERFAAEDGKVVDVTQCLEDRIALDSGPNRDLQALVVIAGMLGGRERSPEGDLRVSNDIKAEFIRDHLREIPKCERRETVDSHEYRCPFDQPDW